MTGKAAGKPLSSKACEMVKPGDKDKADVGENRGLRVSCGATGVKSFFYRYTSPLTGKLAQGKIGNFPQTSLAAACLKLHELKLLRQEGRCPASELKQDKLQRAIEAEQAKIPELTVQGLIHLRETKSGGERYVQLSDQAIDFLKVLHLTSDKYLFPSQAIKKPIQQKYLTENSWRLREAVKCLIYLIGRRTICVVQYGQGYPVCNVQTRWLRPYWGIQVAALKGFIICISMMRSAGSGCKCGLIIWRGFQSMLLWK